MSGDTPLLLTAPQAAKLLTVCERTLWELTKRGALPAVRISKRAVRYDPADLARFIHARKQTAERNGVAAIHR
jgi:excisionase family DNA binding protein